MTKVPTSLYAATLCGMKFCGTGTLFYKLLDPSLSKNLWVTSKNSRHHNGDMKQVSFWGPTNINCHHTKYFFPGYVAPGVYAAVL